MEGFAVLFFLFSILRVSYSVDTINAAKSLADGDTIVSSQGSFELGFFNPKGSANRYVGILFKKISNGTVVWIANRDSPLTDSSGVLKITQQGNLSLVNEKNITIWSSNFSRPMQNPVAQLLDSGNLVVRDASDGNEPKNFLWQSFDHPTDTLLPGMKLGKNFVTGIDRILRSWKSDSDPSSSEFSFLFDSHGYPQEFLLQGSVEKFRSGPWNGLRFSGSPGLKPNAIYTYKFVFNEEELYYGFDLINESVYSRLVLNQNGVLQRSTWNNRTQSWTIYVNAPADNCDEYGLCKAHGICNMDSSPVCDCLDKFVPKYPNDWAATDWSNGCVRRTSLVCGQGEGFVKYSGIKLPDTRNSWYNTSMSLVECEDKCLKNCACMAYATLDISNGTGCLHWFDDLMDIRELKDSGQDIYVRMASSELGGSNWTTGKKIAIALTVPLGLLLLGLIFVLYIRKKKEKQHQQRQLHTQLQMEGGISHSSEHLRNYSENQNEDLELPLFDLAIIVDATDNFLPKKKLGEGGFGSVYQGMLKDGREIAVKRLSKHSVQGLDEFKNEVIFIVKLQHRNLVKLLGCCIDGEEKMLIYEYMPNKSLDYFIFDEIRRKLLDWPTRFNIINGIARGLLYLHQDSRLRIIHRDLKASNVLLDLEMNPKISDFGMARSFGGNETEGNTKRVVGTYGYMSPEYAVDGVFSVKSDVFSFGVLVLEIVTGKRNRGFLHHDHHHNLIGHAWLLHKEGRSVELIDEHLGNSCYLSEVLRSTHVALLCVQQNPEDRPSMSSVVVMLGSDGELPTPKTPGFFTERNLFFDPDTSSGKQPISSGNELSITLLEAR